MDGAGNTNSSNNLLVHTDRRGDRRDTRLGLFDGGGPALLLRFIKRGREGLSGRNDPGAPDRRIAKSAGYGACERVLPIERRQPRLSVGRDVKRNAGDELRLIDQSRPGALRICDPCEAVGIDNRDPTKPFC